MRPSTTRGTEQLEAISVRDAQKIEAILFLENEPIALKKLAETTQLDEPTVEAGIRTLNERYKGTGSALEVREVDEGLHQLQLEGGFASDLAKELQVVRRTMPKGILEVLSIVAYKQPITRMEIDAIRGVGSQHALKALLSEGFVAAQGTKPVPGNPHLYVTTEKFLRHFTLGSLQDLPPLPEVKSYDFLGENNNE